LSSMPHPYSSIVDTRSLTTSSWPRSLNREATPACPTIRHNRSLSGSRWGPHPHMRVAPVLVRRPSRGSDDAVRYR
jgi:hypothetical protein